MYTCDRCQRTILYTKSWSKHSLLQLSAEEIDFLSIFSL